LKPEKLERLNASQIDELSKILGVEATTIKEAFNFYFPGADYAMEEGLNSMEKNRALLMYSGFKLGYLAAITYLAKTTKWEEVLGYLKNLEESGTP